MAEYGKCRYRENHTGEEVASMRVVSSKEYANNVEDVITGTMERAVGKAWAEIARAYGFEKDFPVDSVMDAYSMGVGNTVRDALVELFELYGMDVRPDGSDF